MKKIDFEVFIENTCGAQLEKDFNINEKILLEKAVGMAKSALSNVDIFINSCLAKYDFEVLCFDVVLCDNNRIQEINSEYRHKDYPTDVISFALFADAPENERFIFDNEINIGEIIISLDKTLSQAFENSQSPEKELYCLLSHGILHLLGFDHQSELELENMLALQSTITG